MRIGLLTYFVSDVPGQFFQAHATLKCLEANFPGASVELVNIPHGNSQWRPSKRPSRFLPSVSRHLSFGRARKKFIQPFLKMERFQRSERNSVTDHLKTAGFDLLVVGADTCLKVDHLYKDDIPFFWLDPEIPGKKIMLSGSAEFTSAERLNEIQKELIRKSLSGFEFLGIRDRMTEKLITDICPEKEAMVNPMPDPTFNYPVEGRSSRFLANLRKSSGKKICMVNATSTDQSRKLLKLLAEDYVLVSNHNDTFNDGPRLSPGPFEWVGLLGEADLVVTGSFHESIFSMKQGTPVFAVDTSSQRINSKTGLSKTLCLMESVGRLEKHAVIGPESDIGRVHERIRAVADGSDAAEMKDFCDRMAKLHQNLMEKAASEL